MDVSASTLGSNAWVLQELCDEFAAKSADDKAQDAVPKSVLPVFAVGVSILEGIDSDRMKKDVRCMKYRLFINALS
jgi:hypothetical protein